MRYYQLVESDNTVDAARQDIIDIVVSLKSQNISSVTLNQIIQSLKSDPDLQDVNIDENLIGDAVQDIDGVSISKNMDGISILKIDSTNDAPLTKNSEDKVDDMATDVALRSIKGN